MEYILQYNCTNDDDKSDPDTENVTDAPTSVVTISPEPSLPVPLRHPVLTSRCSMGILKKHLNGLALESIPCHKFLSITRKLMVLLNSSVLLVT